VGYAVGSARVIAALAKLQIPWAVNSLSLLAARVALADQAHLQETIAQICSDCQRLYAGLNQRSWLRAYPTAANFLLVRFAGIAAEPLRASLEAQGIRARWRADMPDCLRLTSQRPADNEYLLSVLDSCNVAQKCVI